VDDVEQRAVALFDDYSIDGGDKARNLWVRIWAVGTRLAILRSLVQRPGTPREMATLLDQYEATLRFLEESRSKG
jgi:hypothetical protein